MIEMQEGPHHTPLGMYTVQAQERMAAFTEKALRELPEGKRLAVSGIVWKDDAYSLYALYLDEGEDPPIGQSWTVYTPLPQLCFNYTNHRGDRGWRRIVDPCLFWGRPDFYPDDQWLVEGFCLDRMAMRTFALANMEFSRDPN